jgi:phage tail sheath protein FI
MPDYLAPGVEIQEIPGGPPPIDGVRMSTAGIAGPTERGAAEPHLITSWRDYEESFGGFSDGLLVPAAVRGFFDNGGRRAYVARAEDPRAGLALLEAIDEISILLAPDEVADGTGAVTNAVIDQCERLKDRFAVISAPHDAVGVEALRPPRDSSHAAFYAPWVRVPNPGGKAPLLVPPVGHIAGIYARVDLERGVHKAPANEVVHGLVGDTALGISALQVTFTAREQDLLNPRGVNVIRDFGADGRGIRLWGARTMSADPLWRYINVRRLFTFVEVSIERGTQWVVFEPNQETTWARVRQMINNFLRTVWRSGALLGTTEDEAFFVTCDRTTMTQDDIDNGRLICLVGIAPVKPAEFVIFRISHMTAAQSDSVASP